MFRAPAFNQNIGSWNTAAVTNMEDMFRSAAAFNQPLTHNGNSWNLGIVTNMTNMFNGATSFSRANYDIFLYSQANNAGINSNITISVASKFCDQASRDTLTGTKSWTINDSGINSDCIAPTVTNVSSTMTDGAYTIGQGIPITVTFSEAVSVTGTPQITLETGSSDAVVNYSSGSDSNILTFNYIVVAGHDSSDLDYVDINALVLNSGTIKDAATNDATLTLVSPGNANSLGANKMLVIDTTIPEITLAGIATVDIEVGSAYTDAGATATDNYDGDLTSSIVTVNPVDETTVGAYTVTYNVTDANGNVAVEVTRTVNVLDTTVPVITLLGDATATIEVGSIYTDAGATASDNYDGDITLSIVTVNPVDATTVGVYTLTYNVTDANGNVAVEVTRTINVVDTTIPEITLAGIATVDIEAGSTYTDDGATATDNYDGGVTSSIVTENLVDETTIGTYTVTYNVTDANGNVALEVTRTINVVDTTIPEITLVGIATVDIEVGSTYTDDGATALDNYDGGVTSSIVTENLVDETTVGTYTVTYNVTDANGNVALEVTRTINVVDTTIPEITLVGIATVDIEVGSTYTDDGATATDNYDGGVTSSIVTENPVDETTVGTYTVTYNVTDASGNVAVEVTRTINVVDTTIPEITLAGIATVDIEVGSTYTDDGATATDNYDGGVTSSIVTENPVDETTVGTYTVTYNVTDANGNVAVEVTRTINVVDTTIPEITLAGIATVDIEVGSTYTDDGATATDNYDGGVTSSIVTENPVDETTVGTYTVTYNVTDANGNVAVEVTRTVNVVDTTIPEITLAGIATVDIEVGSTYTDDGATATDNYDGGVTSSIVTENPVDETTVGTYTVTYNVTDANGNVAVEVTRIVNVVDTIIPVITLAGIATVDIEAGSTYTDDGATATDNYDGGVTSSIVTENLVDETTVGTYTVTYNVTDANGNVAVEVTRTVNVVDTTIPEITLAGIATVDIEVGSTYTDDGATATDNYDGGVTSSIVTENLVDETTVGTYTVTYNVTDANGNVAVEVTRTVNVVDTTIPVITLAGIATVDIEVGSTYTDDGATALDNYDGGVTSSIVTENLVDETTVGTYTVTYNVTDANGNVAVEVTRICKCGRHHNPSNYLSRYCNS